MENNTKGQFYSNTLEIIDETSKLLISDYQNKKKFIKIIDRLKETG